jgi:hypothetical protein
LLKFRKFVTTNLEVLDQKALADQGFTSQSDRIENIIATIYAADRDETAQRSLKREGIERLARELEGIMIKRNQAENVNQICSMICIRFQDDGRAWLARDAQEILDTKYKRKAREQSSIQSPPGGADLPVECSIMAKDVLQWLMNFSENFDPEDVDNKTNQKILDYLYDITHKHEEYCEENRIAHHNIHDAKTSFDEANEIADRRYQGKISKPHSPIARSVAIQTVDRQAYEETLGLCKDITAWANKQINNYPSQRLDQAIRWRDAVIAVRKIVRQYVDDKARRTILQWAKINSNMALHGGTAASSMSAQPVWQPGTSCEQMIDPDSLEPAYRTITKEQIDARGPKYAVDTDFMVRQLILTDMMEERYIQGEIGWGEWRAWSASEKLSRNA